MITASSSLVISFNHQKNPLSCSSLTSQACAFQLPQIRHYWQCYQVLCRLSRAPLDIVRTLISLLIPLKFVDWNLKMLLHPFSWLDVSILNYLSKAIECWTMGSDKFGSQLDRKSKTCSFTFLNMYVSWIEREKILISSERPYHVLSENGSFYRGLRNSSRDLEEWNKGKKSADSAEI